MSRPIPRLLRLALVAAVPVALLFSFRLTTAAPAQQGAATCQWIRLGTAQNRSQASLVGVPGVGALEFGGVDEKAIATQSTVENDAYQLDLTTSEAGTWTQLQTTGSDPGKRAQHAAVMRTLAGGGLQMITYGGVDKVSAGAGAPPPGTFTWQSPLLGGGSAIQSRQEEYTPLDIVNNAHTLTLSGGNATWAAISGAQGQPRADHSAIYFPDEDAYIMFGGRSTELASSADNSAWKLSLTDPMKWTRIQAASGPSKRFGHSAVYDPVAKRMIVFGGTTDWKTGTNEVWALNLAGGTATATWEKLATGGPPVQPRFDHGAAYLPNLKWMVIFGGTGNGKDALNADASALDLSANPPRWMNLSPGGTAPAGVIGVAATYSEMGDQAIFYGGSAQQRSKRDAWALKCGGPSVPTPSSMPPSPTSESATSTPPAGTEVPPGATNTPVATPTLCPSGPPEQLLVEAVTSPTNLLMQTVVVRVSNGEAVTVTTESGVFTTTGSFDVNTNPARVEVTLRPNTLHHLTVTARIRQYTRPGMGECLFGGGTLTTDADRNGKALVIQQTSTAEATPTPKAGHNVFLPMGLRSHALPGR